MRLIEIEVLAFVFLVILGCGWLKGESKELAHGVIDCTTATAKDAVQQFGPVVDALLVQSADGDKINWQPMRDLTHGFTANLGGCVMATVVARLLNSPADPSAPKASQLELDPRSLRAGFDELRNLQLGGATFQTDYGEL